jgi:hypothetical protein
MKKGEWDGQKVTHLLFFFSPHLTKKDGDENLEDQGVAIILL